MSNEQEDTSKKTNVGNDDDLEELLDSAIDDFDKPSKSDSTSLAPQSAPLTDEVDLSAAQSAEPWTDEFLLDFQKHFEDNMKSLLEGGGGESGPVSSEGFEAKLQKLMQETAKKFSEAPVDPATSSAIAESFKSLSEDSENIHPQFDPEALSSLLGDMNLGGGTEGANPLMFMENMLKSFISKPLLYPTLKLISEKYPAWLEEHQSTLSPTDYQNYSKQHKLIEDVCKEFEAESPDDSEEKKAARFEQVLSLMDEVQKFGRPPQELIGEGSIDPNQLPIDPSQCSVM